MKNHNRLIYPMQTMDGDNMCFISDLIKWKKKGNYLIIFTHNILWHEPLLQIVKGAIGSFQS